MKKWSKISAEDFATRFKNPLLRDSVRFFLSPILFEMFVLLAMDQKASGYPTCGSLEFAKLIKRKYLSLGGQINCNSRVSKITVTHNKATGIQLENGEIYEADIVVSAADGRTTIFNLLEGKYTDDRITDIYENMKLHPSKIQVALGIDRVFKDAPHKIKYILDKPFAISDGNQYNSIDVHIFNKVPTLAPPGKTLVVIQFDTSNSDYWTTLREQDIQKYRQAKEKIAQDLIDILEEKLGNIRGKVEMIDVATPATYIRYTGNWKGSTQGWAGEKIFERNPIKKELPNLSNFYMIGQWVEPGGGVPTVFKSGRDIAQIICKKDRKKFKTSQD